MAANNKNNVALIILGVVSAGVLGYLMWQFLIPPAPVSSNPETTVSSDDQSAIIQSPEFKQLQPYANLPILPFNVGRKNPFDGLPEPGASANVNANTDANANANANANENVNAIPRANQILNVPVPSENKNENTNAAL